MSVWALGHDVRIELKKRLRRISAFNITLHDRINLREVWPLLKDTPSDIDQIKIVGISTTEWISEYRTLAGKNIVLIDFEQINALGFQVALSLKRELPIFHFTENLIRASELIISSGAVARGLNCAEAAHFYLHKFALTEGTAPHLPRPIYVPGLDDCIPILESVIPAFIIGHELGHCFYKLGLNPYNIKATLDTGFDETQYSRPIGKANLLFAHHGINFEYVIEDGSLRGAARRGMHIARNIEKIKSTIIEEAYADFFGFIAASHAASRRNIPCDHLFLAFALIFEGLSRLEILRQLTEDLTGPRKRQLLTFKAPSIPARFAIMIYSLSKVIERQIEAPKPTIQFWKNFSRISEIANNKDLLERARNGMDRSRTIAQRAVLHAVKEDKDKFASRWPFFQKNRNDIDKMMAHLLNEVMSPWQVPDSYVDPTSMISWKPKRLYDPIEETANIGFGAAISVLTAMLSNPSSNNNEFGKAYLAGKPTVQEAIRRARTPRTRAREQFIEFPPKI